MTKQEILNALIEIATHGERQPFLSSDCVDQDDLFVVQDKLGAVMAAIATDLQTDVLEQKMPWAFACTRETDGQA